MQTRLDEFVSKHRKKYVPKTGAHDELDPPVGVLDLHGGDSGNGNHSQLDGGMFDDASAEIAGIDSRLHALQHFLKSVRVDNS